MRLTAPGGAGATPGESARLPPSEGSSACAPDAGLLGGDDCVALVLLESVADRPDAAPELPAVAVLSKGFCPTAVAAVPPSKAVEGGVSDAALYGVAPVSAGPAAALYGVASVSAGPAAVLSDDSGLCSTPAASQAAASAT